MQAAHGPGDLPSRGQRSAAVWVSADGTMRVYTRRFRTFFSALALAMGLGAVEGPTRDLAVEDVSTARTSGLCALALALLVAYRFMRMAIVVTPGRLTLRGFWRARSLPATDIARFEPPPYDRITLR